MCISFQTIRYSSEKQSAVISVFSMTSVGMAVSINCNNDIIFCMAIPINCGIMVV